MASKYKIGDVVYVSGDFGHGTSAYAAEVIAISRELITHNAETNEPIYGFIYTVVPLFSVESDRRIVHEPNILADYNNKQEMAKYR